MAQPARTAVRVAAASTAEAQVECVAVEAAGQRVFAGTAAGTLLLYELPTSSDAGADAAQQQQLRLVAKRAVGRKAVEARAALRCASGELLCASARRRC